MTKLSPAALTVWSAFLDHYEWEVTQTELCAVAAALRAAADQVVPEDYDPPTKHDEFVRGMVAGKTLRNADVRAALYRIATELEGQ